MRALAAIVAVLLAGCSQRSAPGADAAVEVLPAGACRFAHLGDPDGYSGSKDIINVPLERLEAPPGGLWWIREPLAQDSVVVRGAGGSITLQVVRRAPGLVETPSSLRVPGLPPGTRLNLGGRVLVVGQPLPRPNLEAVVLRYAHRADLGGTGITIDLPATMRGQILIQQAWVGPPGANVQVGVQVLDHLLLSDVPAICNPASGADPLFVPLWMGQTSQGLGATLGDADDLGNTRFRRLCQTPYQPTACLPCQGC